MRDYGRVSPTFWTGSTGRAIRAEGRDAQLVALYLMTAPSSTMSGLYYMPIPTLSHETGIPLQGASKALRCLEKVGFAFYDQATETIWVQEMASFQIDRFMKPGDKRIVGIKREIERHVKSPFYLKFYERYGAVFNLGEPSPLQAPSKPLRFQDQDQDQEQEQDQSTEGAQGKLLPAGVNLGKPASDSQGATVDKFVHLALPILAELSEARKRVIPGARDIRPTYGSLALICERLDAGKTVEECRSVIAACEAECRRDPQSAKWFDATSPWRPENFERKLAGAGVEIERYSGFRGPMAHVAETKDETDDL